MIEHSYTLICDCCEDEEEIRILKRGAITQRELNSYRVPFAHYGHVCDACLEELDTSDTEEVQA
jgi:hypothetical protein